LSFILPHPTSDGQICLVILSAWQAHKHVSFGVGEFYLSVKSGFIFNKGNLLRD